MAEYKLSLFFTHTPEVYVGLFEQDLQEGARSKLEKRMYGAQGAAQNWSIKYVTVLVDLIDFGKERQVLAISICRVVSTS